jgi:hypothetical protein
MRLFICVLILCLFSIINVVHSDCGTTPYEAAVQLVNGDCIGPPSVWVDETTGIVYVTCYWGFYGCTSYSDYHCYNVIAINGTTVTNVATSAQCSFPSGIHGKNGMLYVACSQDSLISINITTGAVATVISSGDCPSPYDVYVTDDTIFVACYYGNVISVPISDPSTITTIVTADVCSNPYSVYYLAGVVYIPCYTGGPAQSGTVLQVTGSTVVDLTPNDACPSAVSARVGSDGTVYAACEDGNTGVLAISTTGVITNIATVEQCPYPFGLVLDSNDVLYVPCWYGNTISITNGTVATLIPYAECNAVFTYLTSTGVIYNACNGADQVIKASPCPP